MRGYCASVVGNLAAVQGGREALLGHALILPALIAASLPAATWPVQRASLAALWRLVADGGATTSDQLGTQPPFIHSL